MSISESGPCSQVKHGLWEEKRRVSGLCRQGGLYSEGKYRVISLGGDFERSLSGRGSLFGGGLPVRFDCIYIYNIYIDR